MGAFTAPTQTDREFHPVDKTYATTAVRKALATGLITELVTELEPYEKETLQEEVKGVASGEMA
ncbi:hypothetical protein [Methanoculleus receptaculi]|jgi:hypothetical protein|uniref:Uncharacterized protein n=1 Tax=Methanoculleus receptaculi TaxID=394967 RepID=A0AAX4FSH8_9EURY|nr:hypothetical protein [Methanoculleus receptaculi]WOX56886.1 hypothetical protein R6Y96_06060 [Methanoculleus receptaculi]